MEEIYKDCRIRTIPRLNWETDCWVPYAHVSWREDGTEYSRQLAGPTDRFKLIDQAELYAVEMAMDWIDAELMADLTV